MMKKSSWKGQYRLDQKNVTISQVNDWRRGRGRGRGQRDFRQALKILVSQTRYA